MADISIPTSGAASIGSVSSDTAKIDKDIDKKTDELSSVPKSEEKATIDTTDKKSVEIKKEIEELQAAKEENIKKMAVIEAKIKDLTKSMKENMLKSKDLQEKAIEEHQDEVDKVLEENMAAYVEANKEGGKGMKKSELKNNITKSMPSDPDLAKAIAMNAIVSKEMEKIDSLTETLSQLQIDTDTIDIDLKTKKTQYEKAISDEAKADKAAEDTKTAASGTDATADSTGTAGAGTTAGIVYKADGSIDLAATLDSIFKAMYARITAAIAAGGLGALTGLGGGGDCGDGGGYTLAEQEADLAAGKAESFKPGVDDVVSSEYYNDYADGVEPE